ncbi:hypothetical protein AB0G67_33840 [Streptomyces sp. NPDC021056]
MSFHKVAPVAKKNTKPAAPAPKKKAQVKKVTPRRRPVSHKH